MSWFEAILNGEGKINEGTNMLNLEACAEQIKSVDQDVTDFCAALSDLAGKTAGEVRDRLMAIPLPDRFDKLVVREYGVFGLIGTFWGAPGELVTAFDAVRLMLMTPHGVFAGWTKTLPAPAYVAEQCGHSPADLVLVVNCEVAATNVLDDAPQLADPADGDAALNVIG